MYNTRSNLFGLGALIENNTFNTSEYLTLVNPMPRDGYVKYLTLCIGSLTEPCKSLILNYINDSGVALLVGEYNKSRGINVNPMADQAAQSKAKLFANPNCAGLISPYDFQTFIIIHALDSVQIQPGSSEQPMGKAYNVLATMLNGRTLPNCPKSTIPDTKKDPIVPNQPCPCECKPVSTPRQVYLTPNCTSPNCYAINVRRQKRICNLPKPTGKNYKFDCNEIARLNLELNK